ncbi:DUF2505 domain-containing protein [Actinomarinicola tropica]|uniref:DUF2505 family protein n=1 Tax=Actinomarinicola tropica TaxID=2789776 RepID=A0A5Q2RLI2_9ACTN|nr:DUF2505 domain-containing protein [Actinomarinicola tropica]QGG95782.1 DUF2505 family protein [Actinomarinicola tropica]
MELEADHTFEAPPHEVVDAMVDPGFAEQLVALPDVSDVEVIGSGQEAARRWLSVRMVYGGSLDPIAAKVLGSSSPSWIQTYRLDRPGVPGELEITPEHHGSLLTCRAEIVVSEHPDGTRRTLRGELSVRVPLVGGKAERALAPAIRRRIDVEAQLLARWLGR